MTNNVVFEYVLNKSQNPSVRQCDLCVGPALIVFGFLVNIFNNEFGAIIYDDFLLDAVGTNVGDVVVVKQIVPVNVK